MTQDPGVEPQSASVSLYAVLYTNPFWLDSDVQPVALQAQSYTMEQQI